MPPRFHPIPLLGRLSKTVVHNGSCCSGLDIHSLLPPRIRISKLARSLSFHLSSFPPLHSSSILRDRLSTLNSHSFSARASSPPGLITRKQPGPIFLLPFLFSSICLYCRDDSSHGGEAPRSQHDRNMTVVLRYLRGAPLHHAPGLIAIAGNSARVKRS